MKGFLVSIVVFIAIGSALKSYADAQALLKERILNAGLRIGFDKKNQRFVEIGSAETTVKDPASSMLIDKIRTDLGHVAVLTAKRDLMFKLSLEASGHDSVSTSLEDGHSAQELMSVMRLFADAKLYGCKVISSAESWDAATGKYQVSVAVGWSAKSSGRAALAFSEKNIDTANLDAEDSSWKTLLEANDLSTMVGNRYFQGEDGALRFVGLGFAKVDGLSGPKLKIAMRKASMYAIANLAYSLYADSAAQEVATRYMKQIDAGSGKNLSWATFVSEIQNQCKNRIVRGHQVYTSTVEHPISGAKVFVSVYGIKLKQATE